MENSRNETHGNILIVDDEDIIHRTLKRLLSPEGYVIDSAYGGEEALSKMQNYDLLISDIRIPEMDGIELLREIKKREIPVEVIMLTGYASLDTAIVARNYGARDYLMKPIEDIPLFKKKVMEGVRSAQLSRENRQVFDVITSGQFDILELDKSMFSSFLFENKNIQQRLLNVIHDSIVMLDTQGNIMFANVNFAQLMDLPYKEILGKQFNDFIPIEYQIRYNNAVDRLSKGEVAIRLQGKLNSSSGKSLSVLINCTPIYHELEYRGIALVMTDITEHLMIKEKLELLGNLVESAQNDMIFIIRSDGHIQECNELARKTFGYSRNEMLSQNILKLFSSETDEWSEIMNSVRLNLQWCNEITAVTKDGIEFPIELSVSRSNGELNYGENVICFMHDITQCKMMEEIQLDNVRQSHANKAKNEFISVMNHEMRTPLNSIIGFTSLIKQKKPGELNEVQEKFIDNIFNSSKLLLNIIDNILDFSKIEEGKLKLNLEKISLPDVFDEVLGIIKSSATQKNVDIEVKMDQNINYIEADRVRFIQILFNLLNNAIKFSKQKGGKIVLSVNKSDDLVDISISDTGIGIKESDLEKIFNIFYQVDTSSTREYNGTGLGLTITKKFVELHGGSVSVKSKYGEGSTFTISIPISHNNK